LSVVSLDHLTLFELTPPQLVEVAAASGFGHVGLRLHPAAPGERQHPMLGGTPMRRETLARMRDTGVSVFDFGVFRLRPGADFGAFEAVLESAAVLGARRAVVNGDEPDPQALAETLARACELGSGYGVSMNLEPTPWTAIPTLAAAIAVIEACGHPAARLLIDTIHVDRSGGTPADLATVPPALIDYVQVCDAARPRPADHETMIYQARNERAFPGDGHIDLAGMLAVLPATTAWSLEAPVDSLAARLTTLQRAQRGRRSVALLVEAVAAQRAAAVARG
jgi:sugar phosphate isomerase/epimerase